MRFYLLVLLLVNATAFAQAVSPNCSLAWDHPSPYLIEGFRLYDNGVLHHTIPATTEYSYAISCLEAGLIDGPYILTLTAYNLNAESAPTAPPLNVTIVGPGTPLDAPTNLRITDTSGALMSDIIPDLLDATDGAALELGSNINFLVDGVVTDLLFYRSASETITSRTLKIWDDAGTLLGSAVTANEVGSGWVQIELATPVSVVSGTVYTISYNIESYFVMSQILPVQNDRVEIINGIYTTVPGSFPTSYTGDRSYFIDVIFN